MIAGLDSSFDRPTPAQAADAYAAGVRVWGGYIGTRGGLGLATLWSQADFDVVRHAGMTAIGFCSGWDDAVGVRDLAAAWGVRLCVDVERGIRDDGPWLQGWLDASGAGLYGLASVHADRSAAFHVVSWYGYVPPACYDPGATWPGSVPRPNGPLAWQFCGTHTEFGLSVDRGWYDDWFGGAFTGGEVPKSSPGGSMLHPTIPGRFDDFVVGTDGHVYHLFGNDPAHPTVENWGGAALPISPQWGWSPDGLHLLVRVVNGKGELWYRQVNVSGAVELDWALAVGQTAKVPPVAAYVPHGHTTDKGTPG